MLVVCFTLRYGAFVSLHLVTPSAHYDTSLVSTLATESVFLRKDVVGIVIHENMNCHNARWPCFFVGNSLENKVLQRFCMEHGLDQFVK